MKGRGATSWLIISLCSIIFFLFWLWQASRYSQKEKILKTEINELRQQLTGKQNTNLMPTTIVTEATSSAKPIESTGSANMQVPSSTGSAKPIIPKE